MQVFEKNSEMFNLLSEGVSEGIIVVNEKQQIVAVNSATNEIFGYHDDELVGQSLNILIPTKYHHAHGGHFKGFMKKGQKRKMAEGRELYGLRKNGEEFYIEAGLNPFNLHGTTYIMALIMDVSSRKAIEKERNHWNRIFEESLNEIYILDPQTLQFIRANQGAQKNLGYSLEELQKLTPLDLKPEYDEASFKELISPLLSAKEEKMTFETVHLRKDGSTYPVEVHLQRSLIGHQKVLVSIILDISDRKDYTEKLERTVAERTQQLRQALEKEKELNELKTRFLSLVSHEFKTPLSSILTSTTLLSKYTESEQQQRRDKHIATIRNKVKQLDSILNDFLSIERLETGKVKYNLEQFPLSKVVNQVIYDANLLLKSGQLINYPEDIDDVTIIFDEKIFELILSNLVHNAIKYSPENTAINIQVLKKNNCLQLIVKDQGIGIPEKEQKFIFNRYFRANNALLNQGTGIGLNIVKQHLENLGGNISFTSKENSGSTFVVEIPINLEEPKSK